MRWLSFLRRASSQPEKKEKEVATETHGATSGLKTPENQEIPLETLQEDVPEGPKCGACYFSRRAVDAVPCEGCSLTPFFPFSKREEFYRIWKRLKLTAIKKVVANYRADQVMKKLYELMEEQDIKEKIGISNLKKAHDSLKKEVSVLKRELKGKEIDLSDTHGFEAHQTTSLPGSRASGSQLRISDASHNPPYNLFTHGAAELQPQPSVYAPYHPTYAGAADPQTSYAVTYLPVQQLQHIPPYQAYAARPSHLLPYVQTPVPLQNQHYHGSQTQVLPAYHLPYPGAEAHLQHYGATPPILSYHAAPGAGVASPQFLPHAVQARGETPDVPTNEENTTDSRP